jgi:CheY-like chemotaxis protein
VEDDPAIRGLLTDFIRVENGYAVVAVGDGQEALDELKRIEHPVLIFLDLMLPCVTGWDVLREIRKDTLAIPIIITSAVADESELKRMGANEVLSKPYNLDDVLAIIRKYCGEPASK